VKDRLAADYSDITAAANADVEFLLGQAKTNYDLIRERFKALDGKATTLAGFVVSGIGASTLLADPTKLHIYGCWTYFAFAALFGSLGFALYSMAPKVVDQPNLATYLSTKLFADPDSVARTKYELAGCWLRDSTSLAAEVKVKGGRLRSAVLLLCLGLFLLAVNFGFVSNLSAHNL